MSRRHITVQLEVVFVLAVAGNVRVAAVSERIVRARFVVVQPDLRGFRSGKLFRNERRKFIYGARLGRKRIDRRGEGVGVPRQVRRIRAFFHGDRRFFHQADNGVSDGIALAVVRVEVANFQPFVRV